MKIEDLTKIGMIFYCRHCEIVVPPAEIQTAKKRFRRGRRSITRPIFRHTVCRRESIAYGFPRSIGNYFKIKQLQADAVSAAPENKSAQTPDQETIATKP